MHVYSTFESLYMCTSAGSKGRTGRGLLPLLFEWSVKFNTDFYHFNELQEFGGVGALHCVRQSQMSPLEQPVYNRYIHVTTLCKITITYFNDI